MSLELDPAVHDRITELSRAGDERAAQGDYRGAIAHYNDGWKLLPAPKNDWEAATWLLAALGDAYFQIGDHASARKALEYATTCPGGIGNPYLHLRLGQVYFEQGEQAWAADELARAYMSEGPELFAAEDIKYLEFLRTRMKL